MNETKLSTQPYKGTRDFYPKEMRVRNYMFSQIRKTLSGYGYLEYDGPMLEPFALYASKTSEEIVNEQLYWLVDRGDRKMAIRPEMTPTLARMVAAKQAELPKPIRWFSIPNLWRYERPQRGRLREHWQLNVDLFGGGNLLNEDIEICQIIMAVMKGFGATNQFEVRLNHRGLTNEIFENVLKLSPEKIQTVSRLLDAAPKMGMDKFRVALSAESVDEKSQDFLVSLFDKTTDISKIESLKNSPHLTHLLKLLDSLKALNLQANFRFDPSIMRGFQYYTGVVFEVYDLHPENTRALFGGGRYDNLVGMFGGSSLSGIGFGMGDVTLENFLETHNLLPNLEAPHGIFLAALSDAEFMETQILAQELRRLIAHIGKNFPVFTALESAKMKKHFVTAEKLGAKYVVFVGDQEVKNKIFQMKELATGTEISGTVLDLANKS